MRDNHSFLLHSESVQIIIMRMNLNLNPQFSFQGPWRTNSLFRVLRREKFIINHIAHQKFKSFQLKSKIDLSQIKIKFVLVLILVAWCFFSFFLHNYVN